MNIPWYIPFSSHQTTMLVKSHVSKIPSQWILKSFPGKAQVNRHSATNFLVQFLDSRWPKSLEIYQLEMRLVAWQAWPPDLTGECPRFGQAYRKSSGWWWLEHERIIFHVIYGVSSFPLTNPYFFRGVLAPPTRWKKQEKHVFCWDF